jgi:8-oxo-dGTP diphosphatase
MVAGDCQLKTKTVARLFHRLTKEARVKHRLSGQEAQAHARKNLYLAGDTEFKRLSEIASGGWSTWRWERKWDEESRTWQLTPLDPKGEPPACDWRDEYSKQAIREGQILRVQMGTDSNSGEGYLFTPEGRRIWGLYGAAGVLFRTELEDGQKAFLIGRRAHYISGGGGKWAFPGGARDKNEADSVAAMREFSEEIGVLPLGAKVAGTIRNDVIPNEWSYATVVMDVPSAFAVPKDGGDGENVGTAWVTEQTLIRGKERNKLHKSFAQVLNSIMEIV